jgi:hypothetical protein
MKCSITICAFTKYKTENKNWKTDPSQILKCTECNDIREDNDFPIKNLAKEIIILTHF